MTVEVVPLNILGGGAPPVILASDTFNRGTLNPAGSSGGILWAPFIMGVIPISTPFLIAGATCQVGPPQGVVLSALGQTNPTDVWPIVLASTQFTPGLVWGKTQFSQCTYNSQTAIACSGGPAVMVDFQGSPAATGSCYCLLFVGGSATRLVRFNASGNAYTENDLIAPIPGDVSHAGDVYRLSYNVATHLLTVTKNGSVLTTFTDNAGPLSSGVPGFAMGTVGQTAGVPGQIILQNWSGGLGL